MRIISGKHRGRILADCSKLNDLRPTTDRTRESLFNILNSSSSAVTITSSIIPFASFQDNWIRVGFSIPFFIKRICAVSVIRKRLKKPVNVAYSFFLHT